MVGTLAGTMAGALMGTLAGTMSGTLLGMRYILSSHRARHLGCLETKGIVLPHGLEPWTSRLLAERSNQLSYESC